MQALAILTVAVAVHIHIAHPYRASIEQVRLRYVKARRDALLVLVSRKRAGSRALFRDGRRDGWLEPGPSWPAGGSSSRHRVDWFSG
jgi:hypothetical protein